MSAIVKLGALADGPLADTDFTFRTDCGWVAMLYSDAGGGADGCAAP